VVLDRTARRTEVPGEAAGDGLTWDDHDAQDRSWWPQGVAAAGERLLVSWYAKRRWGVFSLGSRLSVVDPAACRYTHVLLVSPRRLGWLSMGAVRVHAGGIAVLGDLVYVADTRAGVRVFRLGDVARVPRRRLDALLPWRGAGTRTLGRRPTGGFTAYGYDHVLPQLLRLRAAPGLRWSFLSVGQVEGRLSLVVGEYGRKGTSPRLARYPLDPATGLPELDADGRCAPLEVHTGQPHRMQGVAVDGATWWVSASSGARPCGAARASSASRPPTSRAATGWTRMLGTGATGPLAIASTCSANSWNCVARSTVAGTSPARTSSSCARLPA
jgi:hypothetical protein